MKAVKYYIGYVFKLMVIRLEKITTIDYEIKLFHKKKDKEQKEDVIVI